MAHLGKKEIDLADYERFLEGYAKLSAKELEVCKALASGLSTRQCAEQIGCATSTIDTYRKRLYEKTGIHKARQLQLCYALLRMEQMEQEIAYLKQALAARGTEVPSRKDAGQGIQDKETQEKPYQS